MIFIEEIAPLPAPPPTLPHVPGGPGLTPKAEAEAEARRAREAAALRENLRRRKAQARARDTPSVPQRITPEEADAPEIG